MRGVEQAFSVRPVTEDDWSELRALRLEMLRDTPIAFGETLEAAERLDEQEWRRRAGSDNPHSTRMVATDEHGRWLGTMGGLIAAGHRPTLVGVYVTPDARGSGVTDALLHAIEGWARGEGSALYLFVHEKNTRAQAAYRRRGFDTTGSTVPYVLDPSSIELEMVKPL